jgi:penicillin-binding protein 1A
MTPLTIKYDAPVKFRTASGVWAPHNYKPEFLGPLTLRTAFANSINTISAKLVAEMGVDAVIDVMRRMGIQSKIPRNLSLALGTADLGLEETAYALAGFPAGGKQVSPVFITRILGADGAVLEEHAAPPAGPGEAPGLAPETAYIVTALMKGVVEAGTGRQAQKLGRPVAGKTGTSTNFRDAWFFGFAPDLLCGVWVGRDDFTPIGEGATGGKAALPIWLSFMNEAMRGRPIRDFKVPPGIVFVRADPDTGKPALPSRQSSVLVPLRRGTVPAEFKQRQNRARFFDAKF